MVCEDKNQEAYALMLCNGRGSAHATAKKILQRCRDHLLAVTINGADTNGQSWPSLIQPLDQGNWDLGRFLTALDEAKFHGPVGLQGYGIEQPPQEHLPASMAAWRAAHEGR